MSNYLLRKRGLGKTSCDGIAKFAETLKVGRSDRPLVDAEMVFRWGCTSRIEEDVQIINPISAMRLVANKAEFRRILDGEGLCPKTWIEEAADVQFPAIVRPPTHAEGRDLWLVNTHEELQRATEQAGPGWYASVYIPKMAEYRVYAAQGRVIGVARKRPEDPAAIAWNAAQGGHFENVKWNAWPLRVVRVALEAFALAKLDFGGVDVIVDQAGVCYVLEINTAPSITSEYRQRSFAKTFDWIVRNGRAPIPLVEARGGYRKFIHPAMCGEALLRRVA